MTPLFERETLVEIGRAAAERAWAEGMTVLRPDGSGGPHPAPGRARGALRGEALAGVAERRSGSCPPR